MSRLIFTRGILFLFFLTLPTTLVLMGLDFFQLAPEKTILHLQREDGKAFQHLEVITPNTHRVVRLDLFGDSSSWPRLLHTPPKDLGPTQKTSQKINEKLGGLFLYDDWEGRLQLSSPASEAPDIERQLVFLLDRSGTMKRGGGQDGLNALARVFTKAQSIRKKDPRPWLCFSFSSKLEKHGIWSPESPPPQGLFSESRGTTALVQALGQLQPNLKLPTDVVIISDGETDTRDQDSLERSLEELSKKNHHLTLLSPDFTPVENWKGSYNAGLVADRWPSEAKPSMINETFTHDQSSSRWGERRQVRLGEGHVVLLRDPGGRALLSLETGGEKLRFHVIGKLLSDPEVLKAWLLKRFGTRPTLILDGESIRVNLGIDSLAPLTVWGEINETIFPHQPGRYIFTQPLSGKLELFHPETGPFVLEGLESWPQEKNPPVENWGWSFTNLSTPLPPFLEPWFKAFILIQIILLLSLWHLRRPLTKN